MPRKFETIDGEVFVQCGTTALRDPATGDPLDGEPMYIKVPKEAVDEETGIFAGEEQTMNDVAKIFADKMRQYIQGGGISGFGKGIEGGLQK